MYLLLFHESDWQDKPETNTNGGLWGGRQWGGGHRADSETL